MKLTLENIFDIIRIVRVYYTRVTKVDLIILFIFFSRPHRTTSNEKMLILISNTRPPSGLQKKNQTKQFLNQLRAYIQNKRGE